MSTMNFLTIIFRWVQRSRWSRHILFTSLKHWLIEFDVLVNHLYFICNNVCLNTHHLSRPWTNKRLTNKRRRLPSVLTILRLQWNFLKCPTVGFQKLDCDHCLKDRLSREAHSCELQHKYERTGWSIRELICKQSFPSQTDCTLTSTTLPTGSSRVCH